MPLTTFLCDASLLFCFFSPAFSMAQFLEDFGDDEEEQEYALIDLESCITGVIEGPAVTRLCKQLGINTLDLKIEMEFGKNNGKEFRNKMEKIYRDYGRILVKDPKKEDEYTMDYGKYRRTMSAGPYAQRFPSWAKLAFAIAMMLPTEASCERVFSILKKIIGADKSQMTEENAAAYCEIRMLLSNEASSKLEKSAEEEFDEMIGNAENNNNNNNNNNTAILLTPVVVHKFVNAAIESYRKESENNGGIKCAFCQATLFRRAATIIQHVQCKQQHCAKRFCFTRACLGRVEMLQDGEELPEPAGYECPDCRLRFLE